MGLSTLVSRVSRRSEGQKTCSNQSIPRRFFSLASRHSTSGYTYQCRMQNGQSVCINSLPYLEMESSSSACASERATKMWTRACNIPVPRRFSCLVTKRTQACLRFFFSMQMRGVGLKNGVPCLQMRLSTLVSHVSRGPEYQRTSFNQSIPRRFFSLAIRHCTSGLHTSAQRKIANQST